MEPFPAPIRRCMEELKKLPGIGPRSAQRILFHLLSKEPERSVELGESLSALTSAIDRCPVCRTYRERDAECPICSDPRRDPALLCVVESPAEVYLLESTGEFHGQYHVLHALLSPLRGITPSRLGLDTLERRLDGGRIEEVILATPPTAEGEATASFLLETLRGLVTRISRIGFGLPVGSDLQYVDAQTLSRALTGRREMG